MESSRISIAIVDDHKEMRSAVTGYLNGFGYDVIIASHHPTDLLQQLEAMSVLPQVCLLDYNMPGMKGDKLAAQISRQFPTIKLAAMTTNMTMQCLLTMLSNGCRSYFIKSGDPAEWKTGIENLISRNCYFTKWMQKTLLGYIQMNAVSFDR